MRVPGPAPTLLLVLLVTGGVLLEGSVAADTGNDEAERMLRFTADHYEVSVFENSPARTYVSVTPATASATSDPRMGVALLRRSWEPRFRVTGGNGEGLFRAEETRIGDFCFLRLRLRGGGAAILNREVCERYELKVRATLKGHDLEATTVVTVSVLDRNDLRPLFSPTTYSARIPEDTPPRSSIAQVTATDADAGSNGQFYYFLLRKSQLFAVAPSSGVLTLTRPIEGVWPEQEGAEIIDDVLTLEVGAIDRGLKLYGHNGVSSTARVLLHLDTPTNRHAPLITAATIQPSDDDPAHSQTVAIITVTDEDSGLAGQIGEAWLVGRSANQELQFALLVSSGFIWPPAGVSVTLQARDRGDPPLTSQPISIQLEAPLPGNAALTTPRFPDDGYRVSVSELAPPGTLLLSITLTPPLEYPHYTLSQAPPGLFSIGSESGVLATADWLTGLGAEFSLEVTESSSGAKVTVAVTLLDENDHAPVFSRLSYEAVVNESVAIGTTVLLLSASDDDQGENGYITYSLEAGPGQGAVPFAINQFSGAVTTSGRLDFERQSEFRLAARASDWGFPERREARATVRITVLNTNDEPPVWGRRGCSLVVPPLWPIDTPLVTLSALDPDDRHTPIKYSIVQSDEGTAGLFLLQPDTGLLLLTRPLATGHTYTLRITATDGDHASDPMTLNVTVATNPATPDTPTLSCQETQLAQRLAEKLSRGQHRQEVEEEGLRGISANQAAGEGLMDLFSANRHAPRFLDVPETIWVPEDTPVGTRILQLQVSDEDAGLGGQLLYSIAGGNTDGCLTVGMRSGDITVFRPMDRERRPHYHVNVTVYDQGSPRRGAWTLIAVVVTDTNDNTPHFLNTHTYHTHVAENAAMGTQVFQVSAVDADEGLNAAVQYSLLSEAPFAINSSTGLIFVIGQLDREATPTYYLRVEARDSAPERQAQRVATARVEVTVTDVNDVAPVLVPPRVRVRVPEDLPLGALVSWPHATDPDEGAGSQLTFDLSSDHNDTFTIDTHTGAVRLNTPLDYETQQVYNITIRVCDGGVPVSLVTEGWLEVEVLDVDENRFAPEFPAIALIGQVAEGGGPGGVSVMKVTARDDDTGRDGQVEYSIRGGSGLGYFNIDQETGVISTNDVLDRETQDSYWLVVYATDMAVVPKSAVVHVYIQVEDVNDNAPLTSEVMYHATVPENSPRDLSIIQISAQDPDAPPTNPASPAFTFRIAAGNARNNFNIHPHTGLITTTSKKLDREQQAEHFLEVVVSDGTHQALVCVCVSVSDVNDNAPVFLEKVFHARVPERGRMSAVTRVLARDRDDGANAAITYAVTDGNQHARFHIHPKTGQVTARKTAPAGTYDILTIKAVDGGRPARWASARLHVEWVEPAASDSASLEFSAELYNFSVVETERVGEIVGVVSLKNSQHGPVWFEITEGDEEGVFAVDRAVGTIVTTRGLDAETHTHYNLTLQASDGTHTTHTQVLVSVLDANDSPPLFVQSVFDVVVTEDTPPGAELLRVAASDRDQHGLTYDLQGSVDPASRELFRIDTHTGAIHTTHTLDHESNTQHVLTVMVKESVFPFRKSLCRVLIGVEDVNDHAPLFTMATYEGRVFESAAVGSAFLTVTATDKDRGLNAHTLYSIESGNTGGAFSIDPVLGALSVARPLDSSVIGRYVLSVRATDAGAPPLSSTADVLVSVTMSDNAPPRFPLALYQATLSEGVPVGTSVVTVTALSRSSLTYRLSGPASSSFSIDQYSGSIVTRGPIDFEQRRAFSLTVVAADVVGREAVSTVTVTVLDVNDNAPHFLVSRYRGNVSEGAAPGTLVSDGQSGGPLLLLANDADSEQNGNGQLAYEIADEKARPFFTVDMATGALRTTAQLDHEDTPTHTFQVSVRDRGRPSRWGGLAWVTVDVLDENDTPPSFSQPEYSALLLLPTYQGVEIITLPAHDPDTHQSQLRFSLTDGNGGGRWAIGQETGVLSVQNASGWEAGLQRLGVAVSDGRFSSSAQVTVAVQQAQGGAELRFSEAEFVATVAENKAGPQLVSVVTAVGGKLNEPIRFSLLNGGGLFTIGYTSGAVETKVGVALDREERAEHRLVVQVSRVGDPLRVARATVHITVTDDNDNTPLFVGLPYYAAVQVDSAPGAVVCVVSAVDLDSGPNGDVSYFLSEESSPAPFLMDAESGQLKLSRPFEPDLSNAEYQVVVFARDHGVPPLSSSVSFSVAVVNRAMPVFDKAFYSVRVSEDVPVSTPILGINASCPEGQRVLYTLTHTHTHPRAHTHTRPAPTAIDAPPLFSIGFETGVVSVAAPLDHETSPSHRLVVRATAGVSGAHAEVELEVTVGDVNDNTPTFRNPNPRARVPENAMIGTPVIQVSAVDLDSDKNGVVRYQLLPDGGDGEDWFHLDAVSGLLLTARRLDRERVSRVRLRVRASDQGFPVPRVATATVSIEIGDVNDNAPAFGQLLYEARVTEGASPGQPITRVLASDADQQDTPLRYALLPGEGRGLFRLHPLTGVLTLGDEWPSTPGTGARVSSDVFSLDVSVSDGVLTGAAQVHVFVERVNTHSPVFSHSVYEATVTENSSPGSKVITVRATDNDPGLLGQVTYRLLGDVARSWLSVHPSSGLVTTAARLDRELLGDQLEAGLVAEDGGGRHGYCVLRISILDVNDNTPHFRAAEYRVSISAHTPAASLLTQVVATDADSGANARLAYSLYSEASQPITALLDIDTDSGWLVVRSGAGLRAHEGRVLSFFVKAADAGSPANHALVPVYVHVLGHTPPNLRFQQPQYSFSVPEDTPIGSIVGVVKLQSPPPGVQLSVSIGQTEESNSEGLFVIGPDGGVNGLLVYSIVAGDREKQFVIDPMTGQIQLNKEVDRETVMSYQLSVGARDSGSPPLSSTAIVKIEISDINDNAPTFTLTNHSAVIQENAPVGSSILQLSVTDRDSSPNGAPFLFLIQSGNEGKEFHLDKEEGLLSSNQIFRRDVATEYTLHIQVWDSGRPSLSSGTTVVVRVIEESVHPPSALPLKVHIVAMEDEFPGGVIGQIQATDSDTFDVLTFGHAHQHNSLFKVSPQDGRVLALSGLDVGTYSLNVTVSDGRFSVGVPVSVHVEGVSPEMLLQAVTLRFDRVAPPTFLLRLPELRLRLAAAMATARPQLLHVLSLQPVETGQLDLLVAVETPDGGFYKAAYVAQKLAAARRTLDQVLRVSAILDKNCSSLDCREAACEQRLELDSHDMLTHSTHTLTHTLSYVTPRFLRHTRCVCTEGVCVGEVGASVCEGVCPQDMRCVSSPGSSDFSCQCPPGKQECAGHSSLSFSGSSFIQYGVSESVGGGTMRVSLRIRTLQSWGIIMYTHTHACTQLKLEQGELWFQVDCGGSSGLPDLGISGRPINDGRWHHVTVELRLNHSSLSLDDSYVEQRRGRTLKPLPPGPDSYWLLVFGAGPDVDVGVARGLQERRDRLAGLEERRDRRPASLTPPVGAGPVTSSGAGFQGCLDALQLNGVELPLQDKRSVAARVLRHAHLTLGCSLAPDACQSQPCRNGGTCSSQPGGGFWCSCGVFFTGAQCETELSVCVPNPCKNAGQCRALGNAFLCSCRRGYTGLTCEEDVNECEGEECENGGVCVNTFGSFFCNCSSGFVGRLCRLRPVLVPDMQAGPAYLGREELIGMATVLSLILLLVLLFVGLRKRVVFRKSPSRLALDPAAAALLHKANGAFPPPHTHSHTHTLPHTHSSTVFPEGGPPLPPQVPVRPMAYTPCFQGNEALSSRGGLAGAGAGGEGLEMSSFLPTTEPSPRILGGVGVGSGTLRRGVVVCSVAPTHTLTHTHTGSVSEVQSLSSFQSDSADDNVYHWDTSDWMPASRLPDIEEVSAYENTESCVAMPTGAELETDYYLGGAYDIDESPPPQGEELQELSPPISSGGEQPGSANTTLSRGQKARPQFHPSQYLPPHQLPLTDPANHDTEEGEQQLSIIPDSASKLSINTNSASDLSTPCCYGDSETDSLEEMQQQTEV
ncbi:protocadherin Fat 3-like [Engraulis encrasicolus]|uniref:protocadherin Fat 3-like n=1 Tax=Engraulis encrasicolus TaxID=184585 RepID=UPI002FD509D1